MLNEMIKKAEAYGRTVEFDSLGLVGTPMFFDPYFGTDENGKVQIQTTTQGFLDEMKKIFGQKVEPRKGFFFMSNKTNKYLQCEILPYTQQKIKHFLQNFLNIHIFLKDRPP